VELPGSIDAALGSHRLYVQCGGEVLIFDQRFEKVGSAPFAPANNLAAGGDSLVAHALDAAMSKAGAHPLQDAIGIIRGAVGHLHELLVRHDDGPTSVFDTRDPGNVALSARHPGRAWNAGAGSVDRFFLTPDEAGLNFKVYVETGTKTI
jgi:hypothetical protein